MEVQNRHEHFRVSGQGIKYLGGFRKTRTCTKSIPQVEESPLDTCTQKLYVCTSALPSIIILEFGFDTDEV